MNKKKNSIGSFLGVVILLALICTAVYIFYCVSLAFEDNYDNRYDIGQTDHTLVGSTFRAALFGEEFEMTEAQINTFFNENFCSDDPEMTNNLQKVHIYFHPDNDTEIYAKFRWQNYEFAFYSKAEITVTNDNVFTARLYDAKLGELELPDWLLSYALATIFERHSIIRTENTTLSLNVKADYALTEHIAVNLALEKFEPKEGKVLCRTNNLTEEAVRTVKELCMSQEGREKLKELFQIDVNDIKDRILTLFA